MRGEGIRVLGGSLGGEASRRLQYWPLTGRVRQLVAHQDRAVFDAERRQPPAAAPAATGALELF